MYTLFFLHLTPSTSTPLPLPVGPMLPVQLPSRPSWLPACGSGAEDVSPGRSLYQSPCGVLGSHLLNPPPHRPALLGGGNHHYHPVTGRETENQNC